MKWAPRPYQSRAVARAVKQSCLLAVDMGLGKTAIALTAAAEMLATASCRRALVIAPKRVADSTWPAEVDKWDHLRWLRLRRIVGSPGERARMLSTPDADVYVIGRDLVPWLVKHFGLGWPFDLVIIDESTGFKSPDAQRFRALRKIRSRMRHVLCLTGTPISNSFLDLWAQMYLVDAGASLGPTFTSYRDRHFTSDYMGYKWELRPGARDAIEAAVADAVLTLRAEDYFDLPPVITIDVPIELPPEARRIYIELEKDGLAELAADDHVTALNAAAVANKLRQAANGVVYHQDGGARDIHTAKLDALEDLLESTDENLLVVYAYQTDLKRLHERFGAVDVRAPGAIENWNAGKIRMLALHPASGGYGLNLQHGGRRLVWYGMTWSLEGYLQTVARLHRSGQTDQVFVHRLLATDTIDERIVEVLSGRHADLASLMAAMASRVSGFADAAA